MQAALERCCGEASEIGHHTAADVYHQRVACGATTLKLLPHVTEAIKRLMLVAGFDDDVCGVVQVVEAFDNGKTQAAGVAVGKHYDAVGITFVYCCLKLRFQVLCNDNLLFFHRYIVNELTPLTTAAASSPVIAVFSGRLTSES